MSQKTEKLKNDFKKRISSMRARNNIGKRCLKQSEMLQIHSVFSANVLWVKKEIKSWMRTFLDEIGDALQEMSLHADMQT